MYEEWKLFTRDISSITFELGRKGFSLGHGFECPRITKREIQEILDSTDFGLHKAVVSRLPEGENPDSPGAGECQLKNRPSSSKPFG